MAVILIEEPIMTVGGKLSNWNAASNPIFWKYRRNDYTLVSKGSSGGDLEIVVNGDLTTTFVAGAEFWYASDNNDFGSIVTVQSSSFSSPNTTVIFEEPAADYGYTVGEAVLNNELRLNYRLELTVEIENEDHVFSYYADKGGFVIVDVSSIAQSLITDVDYTVPGSNLPTDERIEDEAGRYSTFTDVSLHELYELNAFSVDNALTSLNDIRILNAANQIGYEYGSNMVEYVSRETLGTTFYPGMWLTKFESPRVWNGWPWSMSVLTQIDNSITNLSYKITFGGQTYYGNVRATADTPFNGLNSKLLRFVYDTDEEITEDTELTLEVQKNPTEWAVTPSLGLNIYNGAATRVGQKFTAPSTGGLFIQVFIGSSIGSPTSSIRAQIVTLSGGLPNEANVLKTIDFVPDIENAYSFEILDFSDVAFVNATQYALIFDVLNDGVSDVSNDYEVEAGTGYAGGNLVTKTAGTWSNQVGDIVGLTFTNWEPLVDPITVKYNEPCENPIMLYFKNTLGGDSWFMFDYNQQVDLLLSGDRKVKRLILYKEHIDYNEWEALNELISHGEVVQKNITDISAQSDTAYRTGQNVYMVDQEGNGVGVIVIPSSFTTFTKNSKHSIQLEIELPKIYMLK